MLRSPGGSGMSDPRWTCALCGRVEYCRFTGAGRGPDAAKNRLKKACKADGCKCEPGYLAGVRV